MDINPSTAGPEELGQHGAWGAGMGAAAIPGRDEGTVEVAQQEGGDLHVQGVGDSQQGLDEPGAVHSMLAFLQGGVQGQQEQTPGDARAWWELDCMETAHGMEKTPRGTGGENWGESNATGCHKSHSTGAAVGGPWDGSCGAAMVKVKS
jgi:hypothetical protein